MVTTPGKTDVEHNSQTSTFLQLLATLWKQSRFRPEPVANMPHHSAAANVRVQCESVKGLKSFHLGDACRQQQQQQQVAMFDHICMHAWGCSSQITITITIPAMKRQI